MQFPDTARSNGRAPSDTAGEGVRSNLEKLRAACRSQARAIDALGEAVSALRGGAAALKAENADLRAELERLRDGRARAKAPTVRLPCDAHAPGDARLAVARWLLDRVAPGVLEDAQLVVSELVSNGVRHSRGRDPVVVRVALTRTMVRIEVEDSGGGGVIAPRPLNPEVAGGFGLHIVQALSERWGLERVAEGGTRVWAQLLRTPVAATDAAAPSGARAERPARGGRAGAIRTRGDA